MEVALAEEDGQMEGLEEEEEFELGLEGVKEKTVMSAEETVSHFIRMW